jgi:hypothetical protein
MTDTRRNATHRLAATIGCAGLALAVAACTGASGGLRDRRSAVIRAILGWAAVALVVSACTAAGSPTGTSGGDGGGATSASPSANVGQSGGGGTKPDPCTLLTPEDLAAQFGADFQPGVLVGSTSEPHVECDWAKQGGLTAVFYVWIDDIGASGFGCLDPTRPVSGIGDEACFDGGYLHVKRGTWDLVFAGLEGTPDQPVIELAKVAVSRL